MSTLAARIQTRMEDIRSKQAGKPELEERLSTARASLAGMSIRDDPAAFLDQRDVVEGLEEELARLTDADADYLLQAMPYLQKKQAEKPPPAPPTPFDKMFGKLVKVGKSSRKGDILNQYLLEVEKDADVPLPVTASNEPQYVCKGCKSDLLVDPQLSILVCSDCGLCVPNLETSERNLSYDQEQHMQRVTLYAYKRSNHMLDWVQSAGGTENTEIPAHVLDALRAELRKDRVTKSDQITQRRIRAYLKKLNFTDLYDHATHITQLLNGQTAPKFSPELTQRLLAMFNAIQEPFDRHKHVVGRNNSLSYSYLLYKICELLGEDDHLEHFSLLKCPQKLWLCDQVWQLICKDLLWEFIPTV